MANKLEINLGLSEDISSISTHSGILLRYFLFAVEESYTTSVLAKLQSHKFDFSGKSKVFVKTTLKGSGFLDLSK